MPPTDDAAERETRVVCPWCGIATVFVPLDPEAWIGRLARFTCPECYIDFRWMIGRPHPRPMPRVGPRGIWPIGPGEPGSLERFREAGRQPAASPEFAFRPGLPENPDDFCGLSRVRVRRSRRGRAVT